MALIEIPYYIIVDNTDKNVTVIGSNTTKAPTAYEEYNATDIAVAGQNTQVIFSFWGTSVSEYHTIGTGVPNTLNFTLDDVPPVNVIEPVFGSMYVPHYMIYNATELSDGLHTLISSIETSGNTSGQGNTDMRVDYFVVTRPADAHISGFTLLYDDVHPAFQYSGDWDLVNGQTDAWLHMNWTLHGANSEGATAIFNFNGSSVTVYGSILEGSIGDIATFALDSEPVTTATVPKSVPAPTSNVTANQILYQHDFTAGTHSLIMTSLGSHIFYFDYLTVTGIGVNSSLNKVNPTSSDLGATPSVISTSTLTKIITTPAPQPAGFSPWPERKVSTDSIVGITVASTAAFTMIVAATLLFLHHRRRKVRRRPHSLVPGAYMDMATSPIHERFDPLPDSESLRALGIPCQAHGRENEFTIDDIVYLRPTKLRLQINTTSAQPLESVWPFTAHL